MARGSERDLVPRTRCSAHMTSAGSGRRRRRRPRYRLDVEVGGIAAIATFLDSPGSGDPVTIGEAGVIVASGRPEARSDVAMNGEGGSR